MSGMKDDRAMSFGQYDEAEVAFGTIRAGVSPKW